MTTISCHYPRAAVGGIERRGHAIDPILIEAGINPKLLAISNTRVNESQMTKLVQLVWSASDDEFMGFTEKPCQRGAFAYMAQAARRCDTLREALQVGTRFYKFITDQIETKLYENSDIASIEFNFRSKANDHDHFYTEFWMITWHRFASWLTGRRIPLIHTALDYAKPSHALELHHLFPCHHEFEAEQCKIMFAAEYLNLPIVRTKADLETFLINSPADLLTIPGNDTSLRNKITLMLSTKGTAPLDFPPMKSVAHELHISPQTLHRYLKKEGTNYQRIKDNIRRDVALAKLVQERLPVHQVAEIVGFSEPRSFTRAFKQWTGLPPREYCRFL